jgi:hypothetical protein
MLKMAEILKSNKKPVSLSDVKAAKAAIPQIDSLEDLGTTMSQKIKVPFQIYAMVGNEPGQRVVLFQSTQGEDSNATLPGAERKGSNNKGKKKGQAAAVDLTP